MAGLTKPQYDDALSMQLPRTVRAKVTASAWRDRSGLWRAVFRDGRRVWVCPLTNGTKLPDTFLALLCLEV